MDSHSTLVDNISVESYDKDQNYVYETMNPDQKANMYDFISNFEEAKKKKAISKKKTTTNLEYFMVS